MVVSCGQFHHPFAADLIPEHLGIAEIGGCRGDDGVAVVLGKAVPAVGAVGDGLLLRAAGRGVDGHDGILAEAGRVVLVYHSRPGEDVSQGVAGQCYALLGPVQQVRTRGVPPAHVAPTIALGIVLIEQMVGAIGINKPIGVVNPVALRGVMHLRAILFVVVGRRDGRGAAAICGVAGCVRSQVWVYFAVGTGLQHASACCGQKEE